MVGCESENRPPKDLCGECSNLVNHSRCNSEHDSWGELYDHLVLIKYSL
jgi:hypothetical protein